MTGIVTEAPAVLLDTCAIIYLAQGRLTATAQAALVYAGLADGIFVSPVSAWEVGLLATQRGIKFAPDPTTWFGRIMAHRSIWRAELTDEIAIASSVLPGSFHRDPGDRLLVATARARSIPIVTSDRKILDYARAGNVRAIAV